MIASKAEPAGSPCVVALRLDRCCAQYEPMLRSALAANECLVEYASAVSRDLAQRCFERSPDDCTLVDCAAMTAPQTRVAVQTRPDECRFGDECDGDEACVLAQNTNACCACLESVPASMLESNACIVRKDVTPPGDCAGCSDPVQCGMCPPPPAKPTCIIGDAFSVCR